MKACVPWLQVPRTEVPEMTRESPREYLYLQVLKDRSSASIYFPTVAANGLNGAFWSVYALAIKDGWPRCWTTRCASKHLFSQAPPAQATTREAAPPYLEPRINRVMRAGRV